MRTENNYKVLLTYHEHEKDIHFVVGYDGFNESEDYYFTAYMFGCPTISDSFVNVHSNMQQLEAIQDYLKRIKQGY